MNLYKWFIAFVVLLAVVFVVLALMWFSNRSYCEMEGSIDCFNAQAGTDGFLITIMNNYEDIIYVSDITTSRRGGGDCDLPRVYPSGPEKVPPGFTITFFTSIEHPDGRCLLENVTGNLDFIVNVDYKLNNISYVDEGEGRTIITSKYVSLFYE